MRAEKLTISVVVLMLALARPALGQDSDASLWTAEADAAYERGDFATAAAQYQRAVETGLDHPLVHYNLGNALFKQGELGAAIASYVRASRLAPRDARIATNLSRARAQIRDRELAGGEIPPVLRPVPWLYGRLSLDEWWSLALLAYGLAVAARVARHWSHAYRSPLARAALVLGGVALLATLMGTTRYRNEVVRSSAIAIVDEIEVRSGPGRDYSLAFRIHEGLQIRVAERRDEWMRIELGGDLTGWVPASSVEVL